MNRKKLKLAIIYNEASPELYKKPDEEIRIKSNRGWIGIDRSNDCCAIRRRIILIECKTVLVPC